MRIVHLVRSDGWAGVEGHVASLASTQAESGDDVVMIGGNAAHARQALGPHPVQHAEARTLGDAVKVLARVERPDILHVHMSAAELAAGICLAMRGVPVVSTRHFARRRGERALTRPVLTLSARRVAAQIAISQYVADRVEGSSTVIHPGVASGQRANPSVERERCVLVAQRLQPEKRTTVALEAFASARLASEGWRLDIAGSGSQHRELVARAAALGVEHAVRFLGRRSDVQQLMARAAILVAPTEVEGLGLAVLEAMSVGLPVVAAAGGGHLETVGTVPGAALFSPGDVAHAARLLTELARDPSRRDAYGLSLQQTQTRSFSLEAQAEATEVVYRSLT